MPAKTVVSELDLFQIATEELERSLYLPNILSYVPYGEQGPFHECDAFGRVLTAGNRAGKTDCMVVEFIWTAMNMHPLRQRPKQWGNGPVQLRIVVVDVVKGVEQIMLPKFKRWMTADMLVDGSWDKSWDAKSLVLTFSNGSTIDFLTYGMTLEKFGGVPRHMIGFDEEPPRDIFNESLMRLRDFDGIWIIAATPVNGMDWIYDLLIEPAQTGEIDYVKVFELDSRLNPYLLGANEDRFYVGMDKEERAIREEGKYVARGGLVFPHFATHLDRYIREREWKGRKVQIFSTVDYGWNNPTAWLWIAVFSDGSAHVFAEHYKSEMEIKVHAQIVKEREASWGLSEGSVTRSGDPAMNQKNGQTGMSFIQAYALNGIYIGTEGIPHNVMPGIEKLQSWLAIPEDPEKWPRLTISPNCVNLLRELKKLRWATYESSKQQYSKNRQEEVHKKDDHAFDALRYWATLQPDPRPAPDEFDTRKQPQHIGYQDLLDRMKSNGEEEFVDLTTDTTTWDTVEVFGMDEW